MSNLQFIFVHGLSGWGSYDRAYARMPYWGMRNGDLMVWLRSQGYSCSAASVAPTGSAWDRACELYGQLAGTQTDYGRCHAEENHHASFGPDFTGRPLIPRWDEDTRLVLLGHSFGGATVRMLAHLLAFGEAKEREDKDCSPLFKGGQEKKVFALVTLASPMNGTTAYDMFEDPDFDPASVAVPLWSRVLAKMMSMGTRDGDDGRSKSDWAGYDMHLDNADKLNRKFTTLPSAYYFSVPCRASVADEKGNQVPVKGVEPLFIARGHQIGAYTGTTRGGLVIDESWKENDGLVNTISACCPTHAPGKPLDRDNITPGIWNIFSTVEGDHMWLQGGLLHRHDIRPFYLDLLTMISGLENQ